MASIHLKPPRWLQTQLQYMIDSCELSIPLSSAAGTSTQHAPLARASPPAVCCRHSGPLKADLLQQFVADRLLELPPAPVVDPETIDRFLARVPHHKVAVLAFSTATKASIPLRHAAEQHKHHVVAGRLQWKAEVRGSYLWGVFERA